MPCTLEKDKHAGTIVLARIIQLFNIIFLSMYITYKKYHFLYKDQSHYTDHSCILAGQKLFKRPIAI